MREHIGLRRAAIVVAIANLFYFVIEFAVARHIGSASLFADSVDFLEDAAINGLIVVALGWSVQKRGRLGMVLAGILLVPAAAFVWTAWQKFQTPTAPDPWLLSATGLGALLVNVGCAFLLTRFRHEGGSLSKAAFLSARNDAAANIAIIAAGLVTLQWRSGWPDLIAGVGIAAMNLDAAREVWMASRADRQSEHP